MKKNLIGVAVDVDMEPEYYEDRDSMVPVVDTMKRDLVHIAGEVTLGRYTKKIGRALEEYISKYIYLIENM